MPGAPAPRMGGGVPQMPTNISVPAPDWAAYVETQNGPLAQVVKGLQQYQQTQQAQKLFGAQFAQIQAQTQSDKARAMYEESYVQSSQQTLAQNLYNQFGTVGIKNPAITNTPQYQARMNQLAQQAGMPSPFGADGKFNGDQFKQQMTPQLMAQIRQLQPGPMRDALGNTIAGYDEAMRTAPVDYDAKSRAELQRASDLGLHYENADATAASRANVDMLREQLAAELNPEKKAVLQAQVNRYNAESTKSYADANKDVQQTQMISAELQAGLPQLRAMAMSYRLNPGSGPALVKRYTQLTTMADRAKAAYDGAQAAYEQAAASGLSGATLQPFASKLAQARASYQSAAVMLQQTYTEVNSMVGPSAGLRVGMKAKSVSVGGPITLPEPPSAVLGGDSSSLSGNIRPGGFLNTNNLPPGTQTGTGPDGSTYYRTRDGGIYDENGLLVNNP